MTACPIRVIMASGATCSCRSTTASSTLVAPVPPVLPDANGSH
jgi:hypothetical protein